MVSRLDESGVQRCIAMLQAKERAGARAVGQRAHDACRGDYAELSILAAIEVLPGLTVLVDRYNDYHLLGPLRP